MSRARRLDDPRVLRALRDQLRHSRGTRYHQRLRGLALVAQGLSCASAARKLGEARRTVYYWVERFQREGFTGLADGRAGRPSRVDPRLRTQLKKILRDPPARHGLRGETWNARALSRWLQREHGVTLRTRQCYRLLAQLAATRGARVS